MKINEFIKYEECAWNWSLTVFTLIHVIFDSRLGINFTQRGVLSYPCNQMSFRLTNIGHVCISKTTELIYDI